MRINHAGERKTSKTDAKLIITFFSSLQQVILEKTDKKLQKVFTLIVFRSFVYIASKTKYMAAGADIKVKYRNKYV